MFNHLDFSLLDLPLRAYFINNRVKKVVIRADKEIKMNLHKEAIKRLDKQLYIICQNDKKMDRW